MKTGFYYNANMTEPEENIDLIWIRGTIGNQRDPNVLNYWNDRAPWKRGIVMWPKLGAGSGVNENASKLLELLNDLTYSGWNNGVPLMINIFGAPAGNTRFNLDNLNTLGNYITSNFNAKLKPILRINPATWESWYSEHPVECGYLLRHFELLVVHFGVTKPASLSGYGLPYYWEYQEGKYKFDATRTWETTPPVEPPIVEPPVTPPVVPPVTGSFVIQVNGVTIPGIRIVPG